MGDGGAPDAPAAASDRLGSAIADLGDVNGDGDEIFCQYWSRDAGFAPPNNSDLTNALRFVVTA